MQTQQETVDNYQKPTQFTEDSKSLTAFNGVHLI